MEVTKAVDGGTGGRASQGWKVYLFCFQGLDMSYHLKAPSERYSSRLFFLYATPVSASGIDVLVRKRSLLSFINFCLWLSITRPSSAVLP